MTVAELIEALRKVEDQSATVVCQNGEIPNEYFIADGIVTIKVARVTWSDLIHQTDPNGFPAIMIA